MRKQSRNPFLFRGPIPTKVQTTDQRCGDYVAIPSYSEVLFLQLFVCPHCGSTNVAIPSYSEVLFLHVLFFERNLTEILKSQSLLIQRSYSYTSQLKGRQTLLQVAIPSYSEVLFLPT